MNAYDSFIKSKRALMPSSKPMREPVSDKRLEKWRQERQRVGDALQKQMKAYRKLDNLIKAEEARRAGQAVMHV